MAEELGPFHIEKDEKTLYLNPCAWNQGVGNFCAIFLFPILMYYFQLVVTGAAISTFISRQVLDHVDDPLLAISAWRKPNLGSIKINYQLPCRVKALGPLQQWLLAMTKGF
ncbi:protein DETOXIFICATION 45, chloroplastic-like [Rhododendron vialii]|uniref:protein DETOXIFICATION 45, chloroplastic-like n=1 Tax=Rhododendron vialii TaxID=182163 RepID=UPI00265DADED|nr:protein DETOXIFICATION 45, chloroplastic-like [Rhododendron vialii]